MVPNCSVHLATISSSFPELKSLFLFNNFEYAPTLSFLFQSLLSFLLLSISSVFQIQCDAIDRYTSKTDTFHEPTTYEPRMSTSSKQIITITFINKITGSEFIASRKLSISQLLPCLIASHCTLFCPSLSFSLSLRVAEKKLFF